MEAPNVNSALSLAATPRRTTFWMTLLLAAALIACKSANIAAPLPFSWNELLRFLEDLATVSAADILFCLVIGLAGQMLLFLSRQRPRLQTSVYRSLLVFCTISVFYGMISVKIFQYLRMPLTYSLIYLAGDPRNMSSSVGHFVTPLVVLTLAGVPALYLLATYLLRRYPPRPTLLVRSAQGLAIPAILVYAWLAHANVYGAWGGGHDDRRLADNPHYELLSSCVAELIGASSVRLTDKFPPEYHDDFRIVSERPAGAALPTPNLARGPKNVILILLESVGAQFMGLYGGPYPTTPRLQAEAAHCLVFDNVYSHMTNTANALASTLLSIYPPMTWREWTVERPSLPGHTVPQALVPRGYRTAFISAGDNAWSNQLAFLQNRGFQTLWDFRDSGYPLHMSWGIEDKGMVDMLLKYIDQDRTRPFYIMSWTQGTHHPYEPAPGQEEINFLKADAPRYGDMAWDLGRYLNALYQMDKQLGRLFDELRSRNLADDTIVLFVGDHGEAFGVPHKSYGHSGKVYQEDVRVPFVIWSPKLFRNLPRSRTVGAHVDISPTILDLLDLPLPPTWQGHSLLSPVRPPRAYFYGAMDNYIFGVREHDLKYIFNATLGREELYDLAKDPDEQTDLAPGQPETAQRLRQRLAAWLDYQKRFR